MSEWIFPTLSEILLQNGTAQRPQGSVAEKRLRAERDWFGAIAALESLLAQSKSPHPDPQGFVLSAPLPVLCDPDLLQHFPTWSFSTDPLASWLSFPFKLLPGFEDKAHCDASSTLSLMPGDPLAAESFCLVLTREFSLAIALGEDFNSDPTFSFSFDPEMIERVWQNLRLRMMLMNPSQLKKLDALYEQFSPVIPDYRLVTQFSHALLNHLPDLAKEEDKPQLEQLPPKVEDQSEAFQSLDVELLQAIAHEVRTPLTTIRTLTRLLLKRKELSPDVIKRLEVIDRECSEQIDRFGLIFRAVEIETSATRVESTSLAPTSLMEVLQQSIPRWQKQASQRNLTLDVLLPQSLPSVVSDPTMLDQALNSLIDRSARSLPAGSQIQVEVSQAGHQLKLQMRSYSTDEAQTDATSHHKPLLKALGQVLMFQPETGSLSLNLSVTKNLFQALGGKLIVRESPEQGEVFTLFLPLEPDYEALKRAQ
jgi:signal transduction histidine kinase